MNKITSGIGSNTGQSNSKLVIYKSLLNSNGDMRYIPKPNTMDVTKKFKVVNALDVETWQQFVDQHPQGNIFHKPEMFQIFAQAQNYNPSLWTVIDDSEQVQAILLPVQVTVIGGPLRSLTTRAILYGSVLCAPDPYAMQALDVLLSAYQRQMKQKVLFTELRHLSDMKDLQPVLCKRGFVYEDHLNYLINLNRSAEELLQSLGRRTRKNIRRGLRDGKVQVTEVKDRSEIGQWYDTLKKTYKNVKVTLADVSLFEATFDELYSKGMAKFLLAKVDGVNAACSLELIYKDVIYGWYGGSDREFSQYLPNEMLMWHILEWGANNGYRVYDFGGAGKPGEAYGVRDFKAKFGGELVCFGRNNYVHAPVLLNLSKMGYSLYRRLFLK